jgi:hypothetical protein
MSIEAALAELTEAVKANTAILEKLEAGREAAVNALEAKADGKSTRSRKKADETPAPAKEEAKPAAEKTPEAAGDTPTVSDDDLRNAATDYIKAAGDDAEKRKANAANIKAITDHFGTKTLVGETGIQDAEQRVQALFYLKRFGAGAEVNFSAEYDFSGDPAQGAEADELAAIG